MRCPSCDSAARVGQRFCEACGAALEKKCLGCAALAPLAARFCGACGSTFAVEAAAPAQATARSESPQLEPSEGERRQLTVLFADVVGATALSGRLDPEALRALLRAYQQVCVVCAGRYGGNIHQYAGDGVLAYFG
jgi:class 3 adenylate cyclase